MRVSLGYARLELRWWDDHLAREPIHAFPDRFSALQFLMRLKDDPGVMASLRKLLAERDDHPDRKPPAPQKILDEVVDRLTSGQLLLISRPTRGIPSGISVTKVQPQPAESPPAPVAAPPPPPPEEPTFPPNLNAPAQAAVLQAAAESGTPFCET